MVTTLRWLSWALLLLALAPSAAARDKDRLPRPKRTAEFKFVDANDDAEAAKALPALLAKYDTPKKCEKLLRLLRTRRSYPGKMPGRRTLAFLCPDGKTREFTYIAPKRYSRRRPIGLLVFLHGAISQPAPGGGANEAGMFAPAVKDLDLLVVGPSTYERVRWGDPACRALVHHTLVFAKTYFNIDEDRVYIAGDSDGGRGTYATLETAATFVAAAVPVIGAPGGVTRFLNLRNVPIFAINGETDRTFPIDHVRQAWQGMQAAGIDLRTKTIPGEGHDPRFFLKYADEVCAFLKEHPREPYPKAVQWQIDPSREDHGGGFPADTFRWIRIDEAGNAGSRGHFEDGPGSLVRRELPRIEATYEGNSIDVQTHGIKRYTVLVSDEMLDLTKPVVITTNGKASFEGIVEPDAEVILQEARRFKDRKLVFANRITVEVP